MKLKLINPSSGLIFNEIPYHALDETLNKLAASRDIQKQWKKTTLAHRIGIVEAAMNYFKMKTNDIALDISMQMGKPIQQSRNEVKGMIHRAEICCELAEDSLKEIYISNKEDLQQFIRREPLGIVLNIAAWNYPLLIAINVIVPALLAGNVVAIKHSSLTPLCAIAFEDAFRHAGAPNGLVTALIMDHETTEKIIKSKLIHHVAFTGSSRGGKKVQKAASSQFIDVGLELGGKDPAYIREDAHLDFAVSEVMGGVFYNAGQSCCAVERIYVHDSLFDEFVKGAILCMNKLKIDDPLENTADMGPLAQESGIKTVREQLKDAEIKGAKIIPHIGPIPDGDNYILPAILTNVNHSMDIMMEETFAPIIGIMPVKSDKEAITLMNDSPYGLTASVWTNNSEKALQIGNQIETGTVFMNRCDYLDPVLPWIGVKNSGKGCTLSMLGFQQLTRPKSYYLKLKNNI